MKREKQKEWTRHFLMVVVVGLCCTLFYQWQQLQNKNKLTTIQKVIQKVEKEPSYNYKDDYSYKLSYPTQKAIKESRQKTPLVLDVLGKHKTAILLLTYSRNKQLNTLLNRMKSLPGINSINRLYISQQMVLHPMELDGMDNYQTNSHLADRIKQIFQSTDMMDKLDMPIEVMHLRKHSPIKWETPRHNIPAMIAQHYQLALTKLFKDGNDFAIILEDDVLPEKDFLNFMNQLAPFLLKEDEDVFCISSWNEFGYDQFATDENKVFRTQYFPGIGWMIHKSFWEDIKDKFPEFSWDWWMTSPSTTKKKDCIVPFRPRHHNIDNKDENNPEMYDTFINVVDTSKNLIDLGDLKYISKNKYEDTLQKMVNKAALLPKNFVKFDVNVHPPGTYLIPYEAPILPKIFQSIGLKSQFEPATHHKHLIIFQYFEHTLLLADIRRCPYLKQRNSYQSPSEIMEPVRAHVGESCTEICNRQDMVCEEKYFDAVNDCDTLMKVFQCKECIPMTITGYSLIAPCGDVTESEELKKYCFYIAQWNTDSRRCDAKTQPDHPAQRLCPCAPA